jgi:ABC-type uncharacterized transport system involved in gliding motility auxiliary subunit
MLYDGQFQYYWSEGQKIGTKMPLNINKNDSMNNNPKTVKTNYGWLLNKNYQINCVDETINSDIFFAPKNIKFKEISPPKSVN